MTWPVRDREITVDWEKLRFTRKTLKGADDLWNICVYVIADPEGRPLYIGRARGKKYRGFGERYVGNSGSLSAIAHGSGNRLYVGKIKGRQIRNWYKGLEKELIALESRDTRGQHPRYNVQFKSAQSDGVRLKHTGKVPRFYHKRRGSRTRTAERSGKSQ